MKLGTGVYACHRASFGGITHVGGQQMTGDQVEDATYYAKTQSMAVVSLKIQQYPELQQSADHNFSHRIGNTEKLYVFDNIMVHFKSWKYVTEPT